MKRFMALYMAPIAAFEKMMRAPASEQNEGMKEWETWMKQHARELADIGAPLGKTKRITADGVQDVKNEIGGYSIVQAESAADAAEIFRDNPHFRTMPGAWIEVIECMPMPA